MVAGLDYIERAHRRALQRNIPVNPRQSWLAFAIGSAFFAGLTAILGKVGVATRCHQNSSGHSIELTAICQSGAGTGSELIACCGIDHAAR